MALKLAEVQQLPMFQPESSWRPPRLSDLPSWAQARRVSIDIETKDPYLRELGSGARRPETFIAGVSFAIEDGPRAYLPLRHLGGDNMENPDRAIQYLRDQAKVFRGELGGANMQYDLDFLHEKEKIDFNPSFFRDVQIADPLVCELHDRYSLDHIAQRRGLPGKDETLLKRAAAHYGLDPRGSMWMLPARYVGAYAERDADLPLKLLRKQEKEIDEQDLWDVYNLESRLLPVLLRMRWRGIRIHMDRLEQIERWSLQQEALALEELHAVTGVRVAIGDTMKPGAIAPALEAVGVRVPMSSTPGGKVGPSIDKFFLASVRHPAAKLISRARKVSKLRGTFATSIRSHLVNGRIHATFNQLKRTDEDDNSRGASYGRLSCENPNMQQQPARDEFAAMWRSIYLPEEGAGWASADFSQQEPRMLVHYAELCGLPGAAAAAQRYREDPNIDNHTMMTQLIHGSHLVDGHPEFDRRRGECKIILLGICYGMGGAKLCRGLGLPTRWIVAPPHRWGREHWQHFASAHEARKRAAEIGGRAWEGAGEEGQRILDTFDERLPFVRALAKRCQESAEAKGYVRTLSGRRCRFPRGLGGRLDWTHKACNRVVQGGAADQMKKALVDADADGHFLQLQVHDEGNGSYGSLEQAWRLTDIMREAYQLRVPFKIDLDWGPSWGEAKKQKRAA
jgi:DNA polymerase I-like protein with 3'-5' exonuclease and polymerase domains